MLLYIIIYYNSMAPTWRWSIENERPKEMENGKKRSEKKNMPRPTRISTKNDYYFHNCNSKDKWNGTRKLTYTHAKRHTNSDNNGLFFFFLWMEDIVWFEMVFGFLDVLISLFFSLSLEIFELNTWIKLAKGHCMPHSKQSY